MDASTPPAKVDAEVFFVTHSLASYLSLIALDSAWLGSDNPDLSGFQMTPEQKQAADYFFGPHSRILFSGKSDCTSATDVVVQLDRTCCWPLRPRVGKNLSLDQSRIGLQTRHLLDGAGFRCSYASDYCLE